MADDKREQSYLRSIIHEFFSNTSTHGLPGIARSQNIPNCMFWSVSFIGFTTIMIYFIVKAIMAYFEYPTNIDVSVASEWPQYFPAVSLCNASPFRADQFLKPFFDYTYDRQLVNTTNNRTFSAEDANYIWDFIVDKFNTNQMVQSYFFSLPSMLVKCSFNGRPCSSTDFVPFLSAYYGVCYTFNAKLRDGENNSVRYTHQDGGDGSFSVGLYIHSNQYVPYVRDGESIISGITTHLCFEFVVVKALVL